jgi:hypothetical protein
MKPGFRGNRLQNLEEPVHESPTSLKIFYK